MSPRTVPLAALVALVGLGCAPTERRVLGSAEAIVRPAAARSSPAEAFGHQIVVTTKADRMFAELVACDEAYVYLHVNDASALAWTMVPWSTVERAEILMPGSGRVTNIVTLAVGSVSTFTHGWLLLASVPVWAAAGVPSLFWAIADERVTGHCPELAAYARYPEGMPPSIRVRYWGQPSVAPLPEAPLPIPPLPAAPALPPAVP